MQFSLGHVTMLLVCLSHAYRLRYLTIGCILSGCMYAHGISFLTSEGLMFKCLRGPIECMLKTFYQPFKDLLKSMSWASAAQHVWVSGCNAYYASGCSEYPTAAAVYEHADCELGPPYAKLHWGASWSLCMRVMMRGSDTGVFQCLLCICLRLQCLLLQCLLCLRLLRMFHMYIRGK